MNKASPTDSTNPVWIVLNILVKTGSVNIRGGPSALTWTKEVATLFQADTTLHWC
jgi:hypothetical protein